MAGFAGVQLAARNTLSDAVLLVLSTLPNFSLRVRVLSLCIVLVLVNLLGQLVLLLLQGCAVGLGQMPIVHRLHVTLFLVQVMFLLLQTASFVGSQRTVGYTICDAVLLVFFALLNPLASLGPVLSSSASRTASGCRRVGCCRSARILRHSW